jgi:hypothetical protein
MTDENLERFISIKPRMDDKGDTREITLTIPDYLVKLIDEEAKTKGHSRSKVACYLIYTSLLAHVHEFQPPFTNTIYQHYKERGKVWHIK